MPKLLEKFFIGADYARQVYRATPPAGTTIDELLDHDYWANVARLVKPHDIIEAVPEDGSFYARLFVTNSAKLWVKCKQIEYIDLNEKSAKAKPAAKPAKTESSLTSKFMQAASEPVAESPVYEAKWTGPHGKWRATKVNGGDLISEDIFQTREETESFIEQYQKEVA